MEQHAYVDEQGNIIEPKDNRKKLIFIGIAVILVIILIIIVILAVNSSKNKKCNNIEDLLKEAALKYATDKELLPSVISESTSIDAQTLFDNAYLTETFSIGGKTCGGSAKITRVEDDYIVTVDVADCGRCTTTERYSAWSSWSEKLPNKNIVDVEISYNYVKKTVNYTDWTSYYQPSQLEKEPFEDYTDKRFKVNLSKDAKNIEIVSEDLTYYRYRDKQWKFYRNNNANYSNFSSTMPAGYPNKDQNTAITTDWSEWSTNAPDTPDYRKVEKKIGYRWYYNDGNEKIYYNGGQYLPEAPDSKYVECDKKDSATIWRYSDTLWRWYSGEARGYSAYMSTSTSTYKYKDEALTRYTNYSTWKTTSSITSANQSYREEETEIRTRYRLKYDLYSYELLSENLPKDDFEKTVGMTLEEVENDDSYALVRTYKYRYRK